MIVCLSRSERIIVSILRSSCDTQTQKFPENRKKFWKKEGRSHSSLSAGMNLHENEIFNGIIAQILHFENENSKVYRKLHPRIIFVNYSVII